MMENEHSDEFGSFENGTANQYRAGLQNEISMLAYDFEMPPCTRISACDYMHLLTDELTRVTKHE